MYYNKFLEVIGIISTSIKGKLNFIKKLVLAWDPDYTKVTKAEAERINQAMEDFENGEVFDSEDINWD